ncbi:MAG: hypothetical protein AAGC56_01415 [Pseudomonadota bacterium]
MATTSLTSDAAFGAPARPEPARPEKADDGGAPQILLFVVATLLVFLLVRGGTDFVSGPGLAYVPLWGLIVLAPSAAFAWVTYDDHAPFMRRFSQASAIFLTFYFATEPFEIPYAAIDHGHPAALFHRYGRWLGIALGVAAWFRPAAVYAGAMTLWLMRDLNGPITGFYFSNLDIRNVAEVLALCGAGFTLLGASMQNPTLRRYTSVDAHVVQRAAILMFAIGFGGHFGNYFYSAIAKLALDGGVFSWLFDNRLYDGVPGALERGTFPFALSPAATQVVYDWMKALNLPLHLGSFAAQFAAVFAIWRRTWVMALTVVYDLFHVIVYVTFGLIFWKWIALNAIVLATLTAVPDAMWTRSVRYVALASVLAGAVFFKTATLAWYDSPGFMSVYFEAEMQDGERVRLPPAFFHSASYQISQARLYAPPAEGHFNFAIWGSVLRYADVKAGRECRAPERDGPPEARYGPVEAVRAYIAEHHKKVLRDARPDGTYKVGPYIHHHMPSPFITPRSAQIQVRDIAAYRWIVESVCLGLENGRLTRDVLQRTEIPLLEVGP